MWLWLNRFVLSKRREEIVIHPLLSPYAEGAASLGAAVTPSTTSSVAVNSSRPVLGTMIVLRRPCASSVMRRKRPRSFSRNSM
jgi:hypothetical protein